MTNALEAANLLSLKVMSKEEPPVPPELQCVLSDLSPTDVWSMSSIPPVFKHVDPKAPCPKSHSTHCPGHK
ncbi:hypothetical protein XELAEV_18012013mg [Xenopus laevis]|uniref:Uncharacterized protein n=1 Tax=Xenopus laevis TaxID=8355 RepID=A0A974DLT9_XENLA|nr:hypothetical protein XELAEV_18012013mg [Xenopus laevis]